MHPRSCLFALLPAVVLGCDAPVTAIDAAADVARESSVATDLAPIVDRPDVTAFDAAAVDATDAVAAQDLPPLDDVQCTPDGEIACVHEVRGRATDPMGAPLGAKVITMCGRVCYSDRTAADGTFRIAVEDRLDLTDYTVSVHGRPEYATTYVPVPALVNGVVNFAQPITVPRLTEMGPEMPDPARGGEVTAGDVTLTVPAGTTFEYDLEDVVLDALGRRFRVGYHSPSAYPRYAPGAAGVLYGFGPFNLTSTLPMAVRVQNRAMLPAGSAVDFVPMGVEIIEPPITAGRPLAGIPGHVSMDGRTVATDPGTGVRLLTWLAIMPRR